MWSDTADAVRIGESMDWGQGTALRVRRAELYSRSIGALRGANQLPIDVAELFGPAWKSSAAV